MTVPTSACGIQPPRILSLVPPAGPLGVGGNASLSAVISLPDNQNNPTGSNYCPIRFSKSFNYSWSIIGAPLGGNGTLSNIISAAPSFNAGTVAGNYVVRLIVTDSAGLSTSATVSVVVSTCAGLASTLSPIVVTATVRWSDDKATGIQFDGLRARDVWALNKYFEQLPVAS